MGAARNTRLKMRINKHIIKRIIIGAVIAGISITLSGCNGVSGKAENRKYKDTVYPLERNGINIHMDCMVSEEQPVQDNILLIHGLTYSSHEFDVDYEDYSFVRFLCDNGYAVWRIDISGYGQSDRVENGYDVSSEYASEDITAAIDEIIRITETDNIDLLGWSWGTVTSSLAEGKRSDKIDRFVLYAPILSGIGEAEVTTDYHKNDWDNAAGDFQMTGDGVFDDAITEPTVRDIYCSNCWKYDGDDSPCGGRVDLLVDNSVELINLPSISSETLIICGDKDPYLNYSLIRNSSDKLPEGSKLVVIEGAAHCLMMEKPYYHKFQKEVLDFLKR